MSDWQNKVSKLAEKCKYILENKELCDCEFLFPSGQLSCHKLILAMASPVFYAMFYGELPEKPGPIKIEDIHADIFSQMLRYIYCDEISISSLKGACDLYCAGKKYIIHSLEKECIDYLKTRMDSSSVITVYEFAKFYNEEGLEKQCLKEIQLNTSEVLNSEKFTEASLSTLNTILDLKRLNISSEVELVKAIDKWANTESIKREKPVREVAEELVKKLRFLTLTLDEFIDNLAQSGLLTDSEKLEILLHILRPDLPPMTNGLCGKVSKRKPCKPMRTSLLDIKDISDFRCDGGEWLTSTFTSNTCITLLGVELCLQVNHGGGQYDENLMVKLSHANEDTYLAEGELHSTVNYNGKAQVMLDNTPTIQPYNEYSLHIFLCKPGMYPIGRHSNLQCKDMNVEVDFLSHTSWERSHPWNTTVLSAIIYTDPLE